MEKMDYYQARSIIESLIFVAQNPISVSELSEILEIDERTVRMVIRDLTDLYRKERRGIQIVEVAGGYQMTTIPENRSYIERYSNPVKKATLSHAALETLAIVAYKQPVTRGEIEAIRGVSSEGIISSLVEKGLIKEVGRKDVVGRPILYGTTSDFLRYFGLKDLSCLPDPESFFSENDSGSSASERDSGSLFSGSDSSNGDGVGDSVDKVACASEDSDVPGTGHSSENTSEFASENASPGEDGCEEE